MTSSDEAGFNKALFIDAAGAHFLTDAFSAGHQFEKATVFNAALLDVKKNFIKTDNKSMQTYAAIADLDDPGNIPNLIVKAIHDKMNLEGFEVGHDFLQEPEQRYHDHLCALAGKAVQCWGNGEQRQLGTEPGGSTPTPTPVSGLPPAIELALGARHSNDCSTPGRVDRSRAPRRREVTAPPVASQRDESEPPRFARERDCGPRYDGPLIDSYRTLPMIGLLRSWHLADLVLVGRSR